MEKFTEVFYWGSDTSGQFGVGERSVNKTYTLPKCCSFSVPIKKISCGEEHSGFIAANGYVYMMGSNALGRLGTNDQSQKYACRPVLVDLLMDYQIIDISCGAQHTGVVSTSGLVFTWGSAAHGALGTKETEFSDVPCKVNLSKIISISCGGRHTAVISEDNSLFVWGAGDAGQLGNSSRQMQRVPICIQLENIVQVSCGVFHTLVMLDNGDVLATGGNSFGQLGLGTKESTSVFTRIHTLTGKKIIKVAAGQHSACVSQTGEAFVWGTCPFGEFLIPTKISISSKVIDIDIGIGFGLAIDKNGNVWSWGSNSSGCLGTGDLDSKSQPYPILELQNKVVTQVSCGAGFVIALGKEVENFRHEEEKKKKKLKSGDGDGQVNKELVNCLEEMKKEISRLQKGTGGLEELGYKLEQSKIKQGHLQNLYEEEQRRKGELEEMVQNLLQDKERTEKTMQDFKERYEEHKDYVSRLEAELRNKKNIGIELQKMTDNVLKEKENAEAEAKQIPTLLQKITKLETELNLKVHEIENIKQDTKGIANHNNVLSQEIKDIPVLMSKINAFESQIADESKQKLALAQLNSALKEENQILQKKIETRDKELEAVKKDFLKASKEIEALMVEKAKNFELNSAVEVLERKSKDFERESFAKIESYSKEISILHENIEHNYREIAYLKEICIDEEKLTKQLRSELKLVCEQLAIQKTINEDLSQKLSKQQGNNKEFLADLEKAMKNKVESMKTRTLPNNSRGFQRPQEEDVLEIYGRHS